MQNFFEVQSIENEPVTDARMNAVLGGSGNQDSLWNSWSGEGCWNQK
jgi:hypothetical protein